MLAWLEKYALTHLTYIALIAIGAVGIRAYIQEHDQRILAEAAIKTSEAQVKDLQAQIVAVNAAAAQKVQTIVKVVHDAATPAQAIAAIPQVSNAPLNPEVVPTEPAKVSVDALPLLQELAQGKEDHIALEACQQTSALKDQQLAAKSSEVAALKKKPSFWHRVAGTLKAVGVGVGIGVVLGATHAL